MSYKRVRDIIEHERPHPIEIRVLKTWTPPPKGVDPTAKPDEICYLFIDQYGDAIEAVADINAQRHFESLINIQSCYVVTGYVATTQRAYMPTVQHNVCLKIGKRATFTPVLNADIPTYYFSFAAYEDLEARLKPPRLLTDYIGRVEKNWIMTTQTTKRRIRKLTITDESKRELQITLWPEKANLIGDEVVAGDIIAITSAMVTEHKGSKQFESTSATTIVVNPPFPDVQQHVNRLTTLSQTTMTIQELITTISQDKVQQSHYICFGHIKEIYAYRRWYYVQCSQCTKKLYEEHGDSTYFVCVDHDSPHPKYMYCMNASIADTTGAIDVVFFNDVVNNMLHITCEEMVATLKHAHPKILPDRMKSLLDQPMLFHLNIKSDRSIIVDSVGPHPRTTPHPPVTPDPKLLTSKRATTYPTGKSGIRGLCDEH